MKKPRPKSASGFLEGIPPNDETTHIIISMPTSNCTYAQLFCRSVKKCDVHALIEKAYDRSFPTGIMRIQAWNSRFESIDDQFAVIHRRIFVARVRNLIYRCTEPVATREPIM